MPDPTKPKKKAAPKPPPRLADADSTVSPDDYNSQLQASLSQPEQGTEVQTPPATPTPNPVEGFWHRLVHGYSGEGSRIVEAAKGAARGVVNAGRETANTLNEAAAKLGVLDNNQVPTSGFSAPSSDTQVEHYLGKRSDDPLASFTESVSQFATGWAATGELKLLKGVGLAKMLARGALVDASAFNPREAQLAELAAKAPVPIVKQLGELLSVNGDDNQAVARLKRAAAGMVPVAAIETLVAGSRIIRGTRVLASSADVGEKAIAQDQIQEAAKTLQNISEGSYVIDGEPVTVRPIKEGGYTLEAANAAKPKPNTAPVTRHTYDVSPDGIKAVFPSQAEATQQAETMNNAIAERNNVGKVDPEATARVEQAAATVGTDNGAALAQAVQKPDLNLSIHNSVEDNMKLIGDLSEKIATNIRKSVEANGKVSVEDAFGMARKALGNLPEAQAPDLLTKKLGDFEGQSAWNVAANMTLKDIGQKIAKMSEVIDARPHDPVIVSEARDAVMNYFQLRHAIYGAESDAARTLRFVQEKNNSLGSTVQFKEASVKEQKQAADLGAEASNALEELKAERKKISKVGETGTDGATKGPRSPSGDPLAQRRPSDNVSETEFSLARARRKAQAIIKKAEGPDFSKREPLQGPNTTATIAADTQRSKKIKADAAAQLENPIVATEEQKALASAKTMRPFSYNSIDELSKWVDEEEAALQDVINRMAEKAKPKPIGPQERPDTRTPVSDYLAEGQMGLHPRPPVAGMNVRAADANALADADKEAVKQVARMFRMSSGSPRDMEAVLHGAKVFQNTGSVSKALEVFTNFLLSGPKTWLTVPLSGVTVTALEPVTKMAAGIATANSALAREGADIMWSNFKYISDNVGIAAQSLRAGRSIINPAPQHIAIGGLTGQVIRTPSRILTALDELTRVTNYRSYVRAKSLRLGREQGLTGAALEARAENDVRSAFDPETGIATIPDALKYADVPTFSGPLGKETFGGKFHEFTNNAVEAKFIAPFIKASVNIFRYVWKSTPGLNLLNKQARAVMAAGGEDAAVLHARSAIAGSIYGVGLYNALSGNLTGRGPSDPDLRKLWLQNNQPYSIRVGSEWVSYRRSDPLATPLGLVADLSTFIGELGHKDTSAEDFAYATVAAIVSNMASKTYMQGITEFAQSWGAGDAHKVKQWIENFAGNLTVPQLVSSFNDDPYYREVRTMGDAIMSRVPGFSEQLDPRYNIFGEPTLKAPWLLNRAANVLTLKPVGHSVEDDLLALDKGLATLPQKMANGFIDLTDKQAYDNGTHVSPYNRLMQYVRQPADGSQSLRDAMKELVASDKWKNASDGVTLIPGGARWIMAAAIKNKAEGKALKQVLEEYPKLEQQYKGIQRLQGAAITGGEAGVADVEAMFGTSLQK